MLRRIGVAVAVILSLGAPLRAQILQGEWIEVAKRQIDAVRKVNLRVIVLDGGGNPSAGATVRVQMLAHDFAWGLRLAPDSAAEFFDSRDKPVFAAFNAVSLDALTDWPRLEPTRGTVRGDALIDVVRRARSAGVAMRWGAVISADAGKLPPWLAGVSSDDLVAALEGRLRSALVGYGGFVSQFDVVADALDHSAVEDRLGGAMVRRLYELAEATAPNAAASISFSDALSGDRLQRAARMVTQLRDNFVPLDEVSLDTRLGGTIVQAPLARSLGWVGDLGLPVVITGLEVGGESDAAAAINLETALWTFFSTAAIKGVHFAGLRGAALSDATAALLDDRSEGTPSGAVFDKLVRSQWWSDAEVQADALGNARARVFAGTYRVSAKLNDGSEAEATVRLTGASGERIVLIEPLKGR